MNRSTLHKNSSISYICPLKRRASIPLPLFASRVPAGFPSPADDYIDTALDLNEFLISRPAATFFVKASGSSMTGAGIHSGDILIVDRSETPRNRSIIIAVLNGELAVKRLIREGGRVCLVSENPDYSPIEVKSEMDFEVWGVVVHVIHSFK